MWRLRWDVIDPPAVTDATAKTFAKIETTATDRVLTHLEQYDNSCAASRLL